MMWQHDHGFGVESKHGRMYRVVVHVAFGMIVAGLIAVVFGYFVMLLWNGSPAPSDCSPIDLVLASCGPPPARTYSCGRSERAWGPPRARLSTRKAPLARIRPVVERSRQAIV